MAAAKSSVCVICGDHSLHINSGVMYCSNRCKMRAFKLNHGIQQERDRRKLLSRLRALLKTVLRSKRKQEREQRKPRPKGQCLHCGSELGLWKTKYCSVACYKHSPAMRRSKAISRKVGKMRRRGAYAESFNPIEVFDRDGWRCQICLHSTPKKRRGTYHPRAPELDHVQAISKGGEHTMTNTQCACRQCNSIKGNGRPIGQMPLFVGIDPGGRSCA